MKRHVISLLLLAALAVAARADLTDNGDLVIGGQGVIQGTTTVSGNAFSVGESTLTVTNGKVGIGIASPSELLEVANSTLTVAGSGVITGAGQPGARAWRSPDQPTTSEDYVFIFPGLENGVGYDQGNIHDATNSSHVFTARGAGVYYIQASVIWAGNASGIRTVGCSSDTSTPGGGQFYCLDIRDVDSANTLLQQVACMAYLADAATVACYTRQDSGSALNQIGGQNTYVGIQKIW